MFNQNITIMEVLAGFYIIVGLVILFFASGFFKNYIVDPINKGTRKLKRNISSWAIPSYVTVDNLNLRKVPVRVNQ